MKEQMITKDELEQIERAVRPLDCGHHYCRYCDAGTKNQWQHSEYCSYAQSQRDVDAARKTIDRIRQALSRDSEVAHVE